MAASNDALFDNDYKRSASGSAEGDTYSVNPFGEKRSREEEVHEAQSKLNYLQIEINKSIKQYAAKRRAYTRSAFLARFFMLVLSSAVTILLGLNYIYAQFSEIFLTVALVLAAITSVVGGISAIANFHELSIRYKIIVDRLKNLKLRVEYLDLGNEYVRLKDVHRVMIRYTNIMEENQDISSVAPEPSADVEFEDEPDESDR